MPDNSHNGRKECFGVLDRVFPKKNNELREVTPECFNCSERVSCLKEALKTKEGIELRAKILERASSRGLIGKIQRWSQKKGLNREAEEMKRRKK